MEIAPADKEKMSESAKMIGPILFLDHVDAELVHLAALFIAPKGVTVPAVEVNGVRVQPGQLAEYQATEVHRARFSLRHGPAEYAWNGQSYPLSVDLRGDIRLAFVSCNGEEVGDLDRAGSERNVMWSRLCADHEKSPFALLMHGGDQVYADEVTRGHPLSEHWPERISEDPSGLEDLRRHLREKLLQRYAALYASPEFAWIAARVPSLMQWDDHDICDGWGSLPERATQSGIGQTIFGAAREGFLIFQAAAVEGDLPPRFADPKAGHLGWAIRAPELRLVAPDLRSERTRKDIMGQPGWDFVQGQSPLGPAERCLLMSSVPLLGPRLSLLESMMLAVPRMQRYEDDLRDQWQSRSHREEWRRMLSLMVDLARSGQNIVVLSGEIHLATRAEMPLGEGAVLHQLVASGIAHRPPPKAWARFLGALAWLGDDPLPGRHIRVERIPGQAGRYVAERNYLVLDRRAGEWRAFWQFEISGGSPALTL
ncbi:alkaline phosphatase D family protein [Paracoccus sp. MBLB3053]|uniref:Alkaline phosphatase D family protein n=1 Tax=Paracoccus aurantius TaxID=3073814 RepID=A0ABU2I0G8_9RHOB|nr:alkaline phosphatase D family protein [Paracoccus sp. MBLB3053]MDS9470029.1 alkaline phosphatase D family protein [Paracoccus sp. MBLB3053]